MTSHPPENSPGTAHSPAPAGERAGQRRPAPHHTPNGTFAAAPSGTSAVIFDLDGTLVDPAGSITGGIAAALQAHGIAVPEQPVLDAMVGPPLAASLLALPGVTAENLPALVEHYRRGYLDHGMAASRVYPGITALLTELRRTGTLLGVATSKPEPLAVRLLEIQSLKEHFDVVSGSSPDEAGPHAGKGPIVGAALHALGLPSPSAAAVMVGDRAFDVEGAQVNALPCIGVAWGYAADGELETAGAQVVVTDADGLRGALTELLSAPWRLTDSTP